LWGDRWSVWSVSTHWTDFLNVLKKMKTVSTLKIDLFLSPPPSICHASRSSVFPHERPLTQSRLELTTLFSPISESRSTTVAVAILPSLHFVLSSFAFFIITNANPPWSLGTCHAMKDHFLIDSIRMSINADTLSGRHLHPWFPTCSGKTDIK
jgi:hypothetical protein